MLMLGGRGAGGVDEGEGEQTAAYPSKTEDDLPF
jgi:hypothetical protein